MFKLKGGLSKSGMQEDDLNAVHFALRALGYFDNPETNMCPIASGDFFNAIAKYQQANGLAVTGEMRAFDATHLKMREQLTKRAGAGAKYTQMMRDYDRQQQIAEYGVNNLDDAEVVGGDDVAVPGANASSDEIQTSL